MSKVILSFRYNLIFKMKLEFRYDSTNPKLKKNINLGFFDNFRIY